MSPVIGWLGSNRRHEMLSVACLFSGASGLLWFAVPTVAVPEGIGVYSIYLLLKKINKIVIENVMIISCIKWTTDGAVFNQEIIKMFSKQNALFN